MQPLKASLTVLVAIVGGILTLSVLTLRLATDLRGAPYDVALIGLATTATLLAMWRLSSRLDSLWRAEADAAARLAKDELRRATAVHVEHTRAIVATATEGIITIDRSGIIETFNNAAERLFGYTADEVIGRNVSMLMPEPYHGEHDSYLERYQRTGQARIIGIGREVDGLRKDGTTFPIDLSVGEGTADGKRFFTAIVRDITARKEIQAKLTQAERLAAVGELSAGVAHEINNPINTIINCAQLIEDGDDVRSNTETILGEGERIATIVKELLHFARDDRDRPQPTAWPDVVTRTLRIMGENFKRHGIELALDVPEDLPLVHARPQQLQQVLLNLLINAKDALMQTTTDRREVRLSGAAADGGVTLVVTDNGPGVPTNIRDRIFEPFVTTKRARGGTGLGLSVSKSIVEGYGGRITVRSEPGSGAEFEVWLPRAPQEDHEIAIEGASG